MEIPGIDGKKIEVSIPEGAQTGHRIRLKQKGMPVLRSEKRGDLYLDVMVETPRNLSKRQKELLKEFAGNSTDGTSPDADGFLGKIKDWWDNLSA